MTKKVRGTKYEKVIDIHAHIIPEKVPQHLGKKYEKLLPHIVRDSAGRELISVKGWPRIPVSKQIYDPERRIRDMNDAGIDIQSLSVIPLFGYELDRELATGLSKVQNNIIAESAKMHPDRFVGLATVPLQDPEEATNELERAMKELDMRGVEIGSNVNGENLDTPDLWCFYEKAQELDAFIFVHPTNVAGIDRMQKYSLRNLIGNPLETSLAIASLIFGGVLEKFPKLKFCFAHAGGFVPYQRGRLEHGYQVRTECKEVISKPPSEYFKLLYFDTVTHFSPALSYLIKTVGSDRVLLGSDYPFDMGDPDPVSTVNRLMSISNPEKRRVVGENAAKLLNICQH